MKTWIALALIYGVFLFWYGGCGTPLSQEEVAQVAERVEAVAPTPEVAARFVEFAKNDDGREFFMVNLNRYREQPRYEDGRDTGSASAEEVDRRYTGKMVPRLFARACHPWAMLVPIQAFAGYEGAPEFDRVNVVRYRSRRDFLDIIVTDDWREDSKHKWAALEVAHSFPAQSSFTLLGPRALVFGLLVGIGLAVRAIAARRAR